MEKYDSLFDVLDALEDCKNTILEAKEFKKELAFMGEPESKDLKEIYRNTLKMIEYNIQSHKLMLTRLETFYDDWKQDEL